MKRYLFQRREVWKSTWKLRFGILLLLAAIFIFTRTFFFRHIGNSLVHNDTPARSDAIVIENYDSDYLVFEKSAQLLRTCLAERVLIPTPIFQGSDKPNAVSKGFVDVMTKIARIENPEILPVVHSEPITLTVAHQVADTLQQQDVRSVIVVSSLFRSRRSFEVYRAVLEPLGIKVTCVAAGGSRTPENWWQSTHGIQMVLLEFIKLQYYRLVVLRRV